MSNTLLFNSKTKPIPSLRRDLQIIPVKENGDIYLYFHDERRYAAPEIALRRNVGQLLTLFDGRSSITDLKPQLGQNVNGDDLLQFVQLLDKHRLLASDYFEHHVQQTESGYEKSDVHKSVTAGNSFPEDPDELKTYLDDAFAKHNSAENGISTSSAKALYAPHIDPRVAIESYVKAFAPIRKLEPKRVVILATSHYAGLYPDIYQEEPFILIDKDFEMPLATIPRDKSAIKQLKNSDERGISVRDRAHRMEHSIEMHLLFLSYFWDHDFSIVPFVVRGLDDLYYMKDGYLGQQLESFTTLLQDHFGNDDETFFLISGDLAHFGRKFGDDFPASAKFSEVEMFDRDFLAFGAANQPEKMLELMKAEMDPYRICGFPPLYTFLKTMPDVTGKITGYDLWDEQERDSAVTFGSILYQ